MTPKPKTTTECKQPDGPDGYHKFCMNTDHQGKATLESMWRFYLAVAGDNCSAAKLLSDDARVGARIRMDKEKAARRVCMCGEYESAHGLNNPDMPFHTFVEMVDPDEAQSRATELVTDSFPGAKVNG